MTDAGADRASEKEDLADRFLHAWRRPPGRIFHGAVAAVALVTVIGATDPGLNGWALFAIFGWVTVVVVWLGRVALFGLALARKRAEGRVASFLLGPLIAVLAFAVVSGDIPLRARWAVGRSAFEDYIERPDVRPFSPESVRFDARERLGTYEVRRIEQQGDDWYFETGQGFLFTDYGFAFLPRGPEQQSPYLYQHLDGPWYVYSYSD